MNFQRYYDIERNIGVELTQEELAQGWHFCPDWDGLLVKKGEPGGEPCGCQIEVRG